MLKVLMATSEAVPFAKTGGMADVCGALPVELKRLGHDVRLIMPAYPSVFASGQPIEETDVRFDIPIGNQVLTGRLLRSELPESDVPVYLVEQHDFFGRVGLYGEGGQDYRDNCQRFVFFSRAVMETMRLLEMDVDVVHCNDWQTALVPAYLAIEYRGARGFESTVSLFTIHNLAYQGRFWHWDMLLTGLDWKYFNWQQMEFYGDLNLMKTGIVFADAINTVSPRYSEEIQRPPLGCGLEGVLSNRRECLSGILNGVDYGVWNPANDSALSQQYSIDNWREGKARCKAALQERLGLLRDPNVPLFGLVGRLVEQKGINLVYEIMQRWSHQHPVQWALLGTGDPRYHRQLQELAHEFPNRVAVRLEFSDELARQIEAGADMFLMPSRYEPCGLNQLYSLKYGTIPIVHETGGLADTVVDTREETIADQSANGFSFDDFSVVGLERALERGCNLYLHNRQAWEQIVTTAMSQDWSWKRSAREYVALYEQTVARVKETICA